MCCIARPLEAMTEIKRVLRPGGKFYFMESVAYPRGTMKRALQMSFAPFWKGYSLGCKVNGSSTSVGHGFVHD